MSYKDCTVLVVDDFSTMRRIVKNVLKDLQFKEVVEAENGAEAFNVLKSTKVDLIVSDWNMPVMTGIELLKQVRAHEKYKELPFVLVTAEAQKDNIVEAIKAKVSNYIIKPFTPATLAEKIAKVMPPN